MRHVPVLLRETVEGLQLTPKSVVLDATLGAAGHTSEILRHLDAKGVLIALDADKTAVTNAKECRALKETKATVHLVDRNFKNVRSVLEELSIHGVDAMVADLGWRSEQFLEHGDGSAPKGFSFQSDEPLLMTYGEPESYPFTARDIVNDWEESDIANVLKGYGEERFAKRIARKICEVRDGQVIETTGALVAIVESAVPGFYRHGKTHPATKTFQALRIAVNDELDVLKTFINEGIALLNPKGRMAIITFHSIEDRIVKHAFRDKAHDNLGSIITKKPILATDAEVATNPRARSAKLRIFEKA